VELARESDTPPVICHGPVDGSHACEGLRFNHAWVEVENAVYDLAATGMEEPTPKEDYYRINGIIESEVKRYTVVEAVTLLSETDVYGPWQETI